MTTKLPTASEALARVLEERRPQMEAIQKMAQERHEAHEKALAQIKDRKLRESIGNWRCY